MLEDDDYVYFFLREQAVEYINCGKVNIKFLMWNQNLKLHIFVGSQKHRPSPISPNSELIP